MQDLRQAQILCASEQAAAQVARENALLSASKLAEVEQELLDLKLKTFNSRGNGRGRRNQDEYEYDEATDSSVLVESGLTYDVDVFWKGNSGYGWGQYEINSNTPNHAFA